MWKHQNETGQEAEDAWSQEPVSRVGLAVKQLSWGTHYNLLQVRIAKNTVIIFLRFVIFFAIFLTRFIFIIALGQHSERSFYSERT